MWVHVVPLGDDPQEAQMRGGGGRQGWEKSQNWMPQWATKTRSWEGPLRIAEGTSVWACIH